MKALLQTWGNICSLEIELTFETFFFHPMIAFSCRCTGRGSTCIVHQSKHFKLHSFVLFSTIDIHLTLRGQFYKHFMSVFSSVYAHILWIFIKMNSINFFHESWLRTHENQFYKILYESRLIFHRHTKQAVIFSVFMKNHKNESL